MWKVNGELAEVLSEWDAAEKAIKLTEQVTGQVAIPSIMELRYAGRRLGDAFRAYEANDETLATQYLADAKFDCLRSQHDAIDLAINHMAVFVDELLLKAEPLAIGNNHERISTFMDRLSGLQSKVITSRGERKKRSDLYVSLGKEIDGLKSDFFTIKKVMIDVLKDSDDYFLQNTTRKRVIHDAVELCQKDRRLRAFSVVVAVIALFGAIIALFSGQ